MRRIAIFRADLALPRATGHDIATLGEGALFMKVIPDPTGPGQESVWSYPRPAAAEPSRRHLRIVHHDMVIADTRRGVRTLETSHPPSYYFPRDDIAASVLRPSHRRSVCEWKGEALYFDVLVGGGSCALSPGAIPTPSRASGPCAATSLFTRGLWRLLGRRRARDPATGKLLWRVDHLGRLRPVQGSAGHPLW